MKVNNYCEGRKTFNRLRHIISTFIVATFAFYFLGHFATASASTVTPTPVPTGTSVNYRVDYLEETVVVTAGSGVSTKFYVSLDKKNWDAVDPSGVVDISSILTSKATSILFKGNKDTNPVTVNLDGEDSSLKVTYTVKDGDGKINLSITTGVEYRKGPNGAWKTATNLMSTSIYEIKGATLYFRTIGTATKRAGKVVTFKVPKRPSAPSVTLDGNKLIINGLKAKETQYRVGDNTTWSLFSPLDLKAKFLDLYALLGVTNNTPIQGGTIELRTFGTDKKPTSGTKVIEVPVQLACPETVSVSGSTITINDTDKKRIYEYTRVEYNTAFNMSTAKWTAISKSSVIIPKASVNDKILVRLKSRTDSTTKKLVLASTYKEFTLSTLSVGTK